MLEKLITEKEAARITGLSIAWFQRKRWEGGGPPYVKFDHAVRYKESDLETWINAHSGRRSTSDAGGQSTPSRAEPGR